MNKKYILFSSFFIIVSLTAGIFVEIIMSSDMVTVSAASLSAGECMLQYLKSDIKTAFACMIFSCTVIFLPCVFIAIGIKSFSMGFSAVCLLLSYSDKGFLMLLLTLLPRALFKLPAYLGLLIISAEISSRLYNCFKGTSDISGITGPLKKYLICFLAMIMSSVIEVFLLQGVL